MRVRALPLVVIMWVVTGAGIASAAWSPAASGHPTAPPMHVVMLQMLWMVTFVAAVFIRVNVAPAEIEHARRAGGEIAALSRAESLEDAILYIVGLTPFIALLGLTVTGWASGAAAMWVVSLVGALLLAPDRSAFEKMATHS